MATQPKKVLCAGVTFK